METIAEVSVAPTLIGWRRGEPVDAMLAREWLVTNGLGGYASGTIGGACTRRFHGLLIAALRSPLGRTMMFNHLEETLEGPGGLYWKLSGDESEKAVSFPEPGLLEEFALERGLPVWRYSMGDIQIEKRVVMPHLQNTAYIVYRLIAGQPGLGLLLSPSLHFRPHEGLLNEELPADWTLSVSGPELELNDGRGIYTPLKILVLGAGVRLEEDIRTYTHRIYRIEKSRGYEYEGGLWSPGVIRIDLTPGEDCGLVASVESWPIVKALSFEDCLAAENARRERLLSIAGHAAGDDFAAQLTLAADQFLIRPHARPSDEARVRAAGDEPRTVIAGYHWFTDWGRDTMISLEGLTLVTGRHREAGNILRTFASYIRDGLIPNMFPEGEHGGLYHTADATMWFFHAIWRYQQVTGDRETVRALIPKLVDIVEHHLRGTRFNIHVDPADGLLAQGAEGYQLTWMDAKVGDWVVTPRRGKAVEINALWYNALRILEQLLIESGDGDAARVMDQHASRARESFNRRFWFGDGQYLYDVVDPDDSALRPNQIFAVSLDFPVLDQSRWHRVVEVAKDELLTPVGLRSLGRHHQNYKKTYDGDLRARDAAYHQGTVWGWLIGPFIDAWLKVHPTDRPAALGIIDSFRQHLGDACIGTISEVFDAEPPYHPRGCAAQAWSVAEVLRCVRALRG